MEEGPDRDPTTTTPLLPGAAETHGRPPSSSQSIHSGRRTSIYVVFIIILCIFLLEIGDFLQRAPWLRILEDNVCRSYYRSIESSGIDFSKPIPEDLCKVAPVQAKLAMLKGWDSMFSCIPGILLAVPFGTWADNVGRKPVLFISLVGITLGLAWTEIVGKLRGSRDFGWLPAGAKFLDRIFSKCI
jgi:hypothetical protein